MIIIKLSSKIKHITENQYKKIIQFLNFDELAKKQLEKNIIDFRSSTVAEMSPFANTLTDWKKEIINSFIIVDDKANRKMNTEVLENILIRLESVSHRIDDMRLVRSKKAFSERFWNAFGTYLIQCSLIKNNDEESSLDLDISEIDF